MDIAPQDAKPSPRADFWSGLVWILLGLAIVWGSWTMGRLEHLQASIYTVPGVVPGLLGAAIAFMGVVLLGRALRAGALQAQPRRVFVPRRHWRLAFSLGLSLLYAGVVVISALPFWLITAIYVGIFVLVFQCEERRANGQVPRGIAVATAHGLLSGLIIQYVFEDLFLVRLP